MIIHPRRFIAAALLLLQSGVATAQSDSAPFIADGITDHDYGGEKQSGKPRMMKNVGGKPKKERRGKSKKDNKNLFEEDGDGGGSDEGSISSPFDPCALENPNLIQASYMAFNVLDVSSLTGVDQKVEAARIVDHANKVNQLFGDAIAAYHAQRADEDAVYGMGVAAGEKHPVNDQMSKFAICHQLSIMYKQMAKTCFYEENKEMYAMVAMSLMQGFVEGIESQSHYVGGADLDICPALITTVGGESHHDCTRCKDWGIPDNHCDKRQGCPYGYECKGVKNEAGLKDSLCLKHFTKAFPDDSECTKDSDCTGDYCCVQTRFGNNLCGYAVPLIDRGCGGYDDCKEPASLEYKTVKKGECCFMDDHCEDRWWNDVTSSGSKLKCLQVCFKGSILVCAYEADYLSFNGACYF